MANHQKKLLLYQAKLLMLLFKYSKFLLLLSMFFLLSCNYQPLLNYEQKNKTLLNEGKFLIFSPNDEIDFSIREKLLSDFGFPKNPKYKLELGNSLEKKKSIVTENNDITRYNLILISHGNSIGIILKYFLNTDFTFNDWKKISMPDMYCLSFNEENKIISFKRDIEGIEKIFTI